jgi:hypothetical protein
MLEDISKDNPVMHTEKAFNYFKKYVQRGIDQFGHRYKKSVDELADIFARQPMDFQGFLKMVRSEEAREGRERK